MKTPLPAWRVISMVLFFFIITQVQGQIVNIERQRIVSDSAGWLGQVGLNFAGQRNTVSFLLLATTGVVEYKSKNTKDFWLLITELNFLSAEGLKFNNTGFGHLRYNRKVSNSIRWEFFSQAQYNGITKINMRGLLGTGPRFKLTPYERAKFYFGIAGMFEYEESKDFDTHLTYHRDFRMSSYLSFTLEPESDVTFASTIYAQPLVRDFADYRITSESTLSVKVTTKLTFTSSFRYSYDTFPPLGIPKGNFNFANGIEVKF